MKRIRIINIPALLLGAFISLSASADIPVVELTEEQYREEIATAIQQFKRFGDGNILATHADPEKATFAECQPEPDNLVLTVSTETNSSIQNSNIARVVIIQGRCAGNSGWVWNSRLEAPAPR